MTRINTNVSAMISQRVLTQNNQNLNKSLERLSTGLAINRGSDGPAKLIASEKLRRDQTAITSAIGNAERADQVANVAEGGLQEISNLLIEVQSLVGESANEAGLSDEEREANQLQIDSIMQTIDRIASTTSFGGTKLLNGSLDFTVSGASSSVSDFTINAAKVPDNANMDVSVAVTASAQRGGMFLSTNGALDLTDGDSRFVFELGGAKGSRQFSFSSGATMADVAESVNAFKDVTGVSAATDGTGLMLKSTEFGSDAFVSFDITDAGGQTGNVHFMSSADADVISTVAANITAFSAVTNPLRDAGQDVAAVVNGVSATGKGLTLSVNSDVLDMNMTLTEAAATATGSIDAMTITGGGAKFNLGPTIDMSNQVRLGIKNVAARNLGATEDADGTTRHLGDLASGGVANAVNGDMALAQKIVNNATDEVASMRGRIGAFQKNVVQSSINSLNVAYENTSAAMSSIRDTDFAKETANLTRSQIMAQAATTMASIAKSRPQSALQLLG